VPGLVLAPLLNSALAYWNRKRGDRLMPARRDIEPTEIPDLLPHVQLTELVDGRLRFRLVGTALVEAYGEDWTGKYFDETFTGDRLRFIEEGYNHVRRECVPMIVKNLFIPKSGIHMESQRVITPLAEDGRTISQFFIVAKIEFPKGRPLDVLTRDKQPVPNTGTIERVDLASL
jgi:hypothetical protein